jgi:hypothetical protein
MVPWGYPLDAHADTAADLRGVVRSRSRPRAPHRHAEVGGLTMRELLRGARRVAAELPIAGVEVQEVAPAYDPSGVTAVHAHRLVIEILSGLCPGTKRKGPATGPRQPSTCVMLPTRWELSLPAERINTR